MKRKIVPVIFIFSLAFNLAVFVVWGAGAIPGRQDSNETVAAECDASCAMREQIGFSPEERASILPLVEEFNRKRCEICRRMAAPRMELIDLIASSDPDPARIQALQDQILANQREMQSLIIRQMLKEKQLLSSDQQEKYFQYFRQSCGSMGMSGGVSGMCNPEPVETTGEITK